MRDSLIVFCALILVSMPSCVQEGDSWKRQMRTQIDTIARAKYKLMKDSLDSLCADRYEGLFLGYVDSIKEERLQEILRLLEDVPQ